jgi:pimeloyl-ACP methyl ester carboxylesterase
VRTTAQRGLYTALQKPVLEPLLHLTIWLSPLVWLMNCLSYLNGSAHVSTARQSFAGAESWEQLDYVARFLLHDSPAVLARGMLGMLRYDATATLEKIGVPVLVVSGDRDPLTAPDASERMRAALPVAHLMVLAPAKHQGMLERHGEFGDAVEGFCAACLSGEEKGRHPALSEARSPSPLAPQR